MTSSTPSLDTSLAAIDPAPSVATIGNFDGVHLGHRRLVDLAVASARERGVRAVAVTFHPHPTSVLRPDVLVPRLTDLATRERLLVEAGVDLVVVLPFTTELAHLSPAAFIDRVLVDRLQVQRVVVGANFRFGHRAAGDVAMLRDAGARSDDAFDVATVDLLEIDGVIVSTSAIRAALQRGDVELAARALGRDHQVSGIVVHGDGRGRTIGVPTANIEAAGDLAIPARGVYAGRLGVDGEWLPCVTNIGVRPTVVDDPSTGSTLEAHVLDRDLDLYGREVTLAFARRLRDERRFDGLEALVAQIRRDIAEARTLVAE